MQVLLKFFAGAFGARFMIVLVTKAGAGADASR